MTQAASTSFSDIESSFFQYVADGDIKEIDELLKIEENRLLLEKFSGDGRNALNIAAFRGDCKMCYYLVELGMDINALSESGNTPLHEAITSESAVNVCKVLLYLGANAKIKSRTSHKSPMDIIAEIGNRDMMNLFLSFNREAPKLYDFASLKEFSEIVGEDNLGAEDLSLIFKKEKDGMMLQTIHKLKEISARVGNRASWQAIVEFEGMSKKARDERGSAIIRAAGQTTNEVISSLMELMPAPIDGLIRDVEIAQDEDLDILRDLLPEPPPLKTLPISSARVVHDFSVAKKR